MWQLSRLHYTGLKGVRSLYRGVVGWKDVLENPFYEKYKKQLERVQGDVSFIKNRDKESRPPADHHPTHHHPPTQLPNLDKIMKVDLIRNKSSEEISSMWVDYFKTKDSISAVLPSSRYLQLHAKATLCPMFVYPLPRNEGYEMWFAQFSDQRCYFTSLINYQENSPISLTLSYYTELMETKDLVLVHGDVDIKTLSTVEAQNLTNQVLLFYASKQPDLYAMVHQFNHAPQDFDYKQLIETLNNINIKS